LHLDRGYTAFGWVERGLEVLELIEQGDAILSATVVPG
jgi:cyclophilin family peptidyl-prolyl cis-trans isomerase